MPQQQRRKLDDKAVKCIFVGYSSERKSYRLHHPQTKRILVSRDVVFVEDAVQPLLSCTKETSLTSQDMYDTLLPLFSGAHSNAVPNEAVFQPMQVSNNSEERPIFDADVQKAFDEERTNIESHSMPKWLVQTLRDSKLDAPLSSRTRSGSHSADFASDSYALAVLNMCDEEDLYLLMRHRI